MTVRSAVDSGRRTAVAASSAADERLAATLADLAAGRLDALGTIWELTADDLFGLALWRTGNRSDAEEALQETFVRLARAAGRLPRLSNPRAYLLTVAHRAAVDVVRKRRRSDPLESAADLLAPAGDPGRGADAAHASRLLLALPPKQRETVFLRHFADLSFAEIGRVTAVPTFTAASRYRLAIRRLRGQMGVEP